MTPEQQGYVQCGWCFTWIRPESARDDLPSGTHAPMTCKDAKWCAAQMRSNRSNAVEVLPDPLGHAAGLALQGWDANGAPTGIDENGDAA